MNEARKLSLSACYSKAWKSFAKWWIPLCLLAAFLLVFEWIPRLSAKAESQRLAQTISEVVAAAESGQLEQLDEQLEELNEMLSAYARKLSTFGLYAAPFVALLSVLIIGTALMAVRDQRRRIPLQQIVVVAIAQFALAFVKVLLLFLLFPLGVFVYIKLYFAIPLMLEENQSPTEAVKASWKMANGNFGPLLGLVSINTAIQFLLGLTIVGFIPATSFALTARATAFSMLKVPGQ